MPNDDTENYPFCRLQLVVDTQLNEPTNKDLIKVPKVVKPTKTLIQNDGDQCNKQTNVPTLPGKLRTKK